MRVLLVDSDTAILESVTKTLSREFRALEIEQVRRRADFESLLNRWDFDLVLTELNLGWAEGIYILRALRERMLKTPVIIFSRAEYEERLIKQATYGFTDYLLKEQLHRLPFTIRKALERAELEQSLDHALKALESLSPDTAEAALRERTEQALVQSEKRFASFFQANPIPSIIATFPDGVLLDINNAGQQVLKFTKVEVVNKRAVEMGLWPNLEDRKLLVEELGRGNTPLSFETVIRCKDGQFLDAIVSADLIEEDGKHYILSMFQDVTDRRRMERSLKFSAQFEALIAEISTHFINLPIDKIDEELKRAVTEIGQFWGVDFAALTIFTEDLRQADFRYYWNSETHGIVGFGVNTPTCLETAGFPHLMTRLNSLVPINIPNLEQLRAEAEQEATNLSKLGIKSAILVPVAYEQVTLGALFLASLQRECFWGDENTSLLKTAAGIMASALTRKRTEEHLIESRKHYRLAVEAGKVAVWDWKMDKGEVFIDPLLKKTLGYEEGEIDNRVDSWLQLLTPKDRRVAEKLMEELLRGERQCLDVEARFFDRTGEARWFLVNGSVVHNSGLRSMLGTLTEITDRKKAKLELDRFFNSTFDMLCVADTNGYLLRVNPAWERALGYTAEELISRPYIEFVHPEDVAKTLQEAEKLARGMVTVFFENRYKAKNGSYRWLLWNATPAHDGLIYAVAHDITERKQAEAALKESEEQLRQVQKMDAIGQLAGGVAHDFNNIITVIKGYCELALESIQKESVARSHVQEIERAADRAASLTRQLLAFSRRHLLKPIVLNPNAVIDELKKMLRRLLREDIDLTILLDPDLGRVCTDRSQLEQVILNLVVNARDAMPDGGNIVIRTANIDLPERQAADGKYVMIAVSDNGIGMDATTRERVFEPFFTTKEIGKGTGLGLSTVYGIVTQSKGFIELDTAPMQGTTFRIYFPRLEQPADVEEEELRIQKRSADKTILLVEDDESVRLATRLCLETRGFKVLDASDGEKALEICKYFGSRIDLVIADVIMPRINGPELVAKIKEIYPNISVLYISGYTGEAKVSSTIDPTSLLNKPFSVDQLFYKLSGVLATSQ